ncbi:MAG: tetratricopeptide repeat protein [Burkholderiaceae bacterium]
MSVLIEALRSAEAARAKTASAPSTAAVPRDTAGSEAGSRRIRWIPLSAFAVAALAAAGGWLWLQTQSSGTPRAEEPLAEPAADTVAQPQAAGADLAQAQPTANTVPAEPTLPDAVPAAPAARRVVRRAPSAPVAAAPKAGEPARASGAAPAPPAAQIERSSPADLQAAYAALRAGRHEEAQLLYARLAELHPYNADVLFGLAYLAEASGDRAAAATGYRRVLQADPEHADALAALAELTAGRDPAPQASVLRTALARRPDSPSLHAALGRLLAAEGRWSEARQAFGSASMLAPQRADYAFNLAVALDRLGDVEGARAAYLRAADLAAADPRPLIDAAAAAARAQALAEQQQTGARH